MLEMLKYRKIQQYQLNYLRFKLSKDDRQPSMSHMHEHTHIDTDKIDDKIQIFPNRKILYKAQTFLKWSYSSTYVILIVADSMYV